MSRADDKTPAARSRTARGAKRGEPAPITMKDVRAHLEAQPAAELIALIIDHAKRDETLRERLLLEVAARAPVDRRERGYRQALERAIGHGPFIDYREAPTYFAGIETVLDSIERVTREAPAMVMALMEYAIELIPAAMDGVDDSDGGWGELLPRVQELHHAACARARPDPLVLAERLFAWEMRTDWELFPHARERYETLLGARGCAHYAALADVEWQKVPVRLPGGRERTADSRRFRITSIMESLARRSGRVDDLVAVYARDLSSAYQYERIAQALIDAERPADAIRWGEAGLTALPKRDGTSLRTLLAEQYRRAKRVDDALELLWVNFAEMPSLRHYQALATMARRARTWPTWRERAIAVVRGTIAASRSTGRGSAWDIGADGSLLVEILLWEQDADGAWAAASAQGCHERLWLALASHRERAHPADALQVYQRVLDRLLQRADTHVYPEAVRTVRTIARLMERTASRHAVADFIAAVRRRHKAKRNFIALLDAANLVGA